MLQKYHGNHGDIKIRSECCSKNRTPDVLEHSMILKIEWNIL